MGGWGGGYLDSGESVCDDVVLSRDVLNVSSELGNEIQVIELQGRTLLSFLIKDVDQRLVVCEYDELPCF